MIGSLSIFTYKGDVLATRTYRSDVEKNCNTLFKVNIIHARLPVQSPCNELGSTAFFHIKHANLYIVATCKSTELAVIVFEFLVKLKMLLLGYLGELSERSVRSNFVQVYEIFDEVLDFGYPQNMEVNALMTLIPPEKSSPNLALEPSEAKSATRQITSSISWRRPDVVHKKEILYIDVIESVNCLLTEEGKTLTSNVVGEIKINSCLSGMPECRFGLNDRIILDQLLHNTNNDSSSRRRKSQTGIAIDDCNFHQCVRLQKFEEERSILFIPPDGEFELMRYRTTDYLSLPFKVKSNFKESSARVEVTVVIKSLYKAVIQAESILIKIPLPSNAASVDASTLVGTAKHKMQANAIYWKIGRMNGQSEAVLHAQVYLIQMRELKAWVRAPISVHFEVPMYTASGVHVRFLKVVEPQMQYNAEKWVRYMTRNGSYEVRC